MEAIDWMSENMKKRCQKTATSGNLKKLSQRFRET
jgi:hypothetical protein